MSSKTRKRFEKFDDEFLEFSRVENPRSTRRDVHAFLRLDEWVRPRKGREDCALVCAAEHDEIWLDIQARDVEGLTDEQIIELVRCGVRYDESNDSLALFV